jgi:hypothetical protein
MNTPADADTRDRLDDVIWGVRGPNGIAAYLGIDERKARHLIATGALPVKRHGARTITATKSNLRRTFGVAA